MCVLEMNLMISLLPQLFLLIISIYLLSRRNCGDLCIDHSLFMLQIILSFYFCLC